MSRRARSELLDLDAPLPGRRCSLAGRRIAAVTILAGSAALVWLLRAEALPAEGPAWLLYALHDALWVPLWSWLWLRSGVWSLLWLVPAGLIAGLMLAEFLAVGQPIRHLQVLALRRALHGRAAQQVLALQQRLGWDHGREGLLVAVARAELAAALRAARTSAERTRIGRTMVGREALPAAGQSGALGQTEAPGRLPEVATLRRMAVCLAYLRAADPAAQLSCAEALALVALAPVPEPGGLAGTDGGAAFSVQAGAPRAAPWSTPGQLSAAPGGPDQGAAESHQGAAALAERLAERLARIWGEPASTELFAALSAGQSDPGRALSGLLGGGVPPAKLALQSIGFAGWAAPAQARAWFTEWARLRHRPGPALPGPALRGPAAHERLAPSDHAAGDLAPGNLARSDLLLSDLAAAERMIDFGFWAGLAERRALAAGTAADRAGWLAALLPGVAMTRPMGELAAAGLDLAPSPLSHPGAAGPAGAAALALARSAPRSAAPPGGPATGGAALRTPLPAPEHAPEGLAGNLAGRVAGAGAAALRRPRL